MRRRVEKEQGGYQTSKFIPSVKMSQDLQWLLTRKTSSYIIRRPGTSRVFSREPENLTQIHSYTHSGLVNDKAVSVEAAPSGKGVLVRTKKSPSKVPYNKVAGTRNEYVIRKTGGRRTAKVIANITTKNGYRPDLRKTAIARASAILQVQAGKHKAAPEKKVRGKKALVAAESA